MNIFIIIQLKIKKKKLKVNHKRLHLLKLKFLRKRFFDYQNIIHSLKKHVNDFFKFVTLF